MRADLVEKAEAAAKRAAQGEPVVRPEPKAKAVGVSGVAMVQYCDERGNRSTPWQVNVGGARRGRYVARAASVAEGEAVAQVFVAFADKLRDVPPKAMRATVKRIARQLVDGQGVLPLCDGFDGDGARD